MPSPVGHSIISLVVYYLFRKPRVNHIRSHPAEGATTIALGREVKSFSQNWKMLLFVLLMGNLPDIDFIPGILLGDPKRYHLTYTHSLGFAIVGSFCVWLYLSFLKSINSSKIAFITFILILVHIISDSFNIDSRPPIGVMMFWPFTDKYFYMRTSWFYPLWGQSLKGLLSKNNIYVLFTEISAGAAFLGLVIFVRKFKILRKFIIPGLVIILFIFALTNLTVDRQDETTDELIIKRELKGYIVFYSNRSGRNQIYLMNANGLNIKQLTDSSEENFSPTWSPDGKYIAFVSTRDGNKEIYIMNKNGKGQKRMTTDQSEDTDPVWMPDGKHIMFVSNRDGAKNFYTLNLKTDEIKQITQFTAGDYGHPAVSPSGNKILYISNAAMGWQIYCFDMESKQIERLTNPPKGNCDPAVSNDGGKILYSSRLGMGNSDIWIMDSNGDNKQELITHPALDYGPRFSPDNKYVVFISERGGNWSIYVMEMETRKIVKLTDGKGNDDRPDWFYQ